MRLPTSGKKYPKNFNQVEWKIEHPVNLKYNTILYKQTTLKQDVCHEYKQ